MIAFVHVAKTAGSTISQMLRSAFGPGHCDAPQLAPYAQGDPRNVRFVIPKFGPAEIRLLQSLQPGMRSLAGHHIALWSDVEKVFPDVQYLVMLREPVQRGASHYQFHSATDDYSSLFGVKTFTWDQWVQWEAHHNHQLKMLSPNVSVEEALGLIRTKRVFVGLMERFDESLLLFKRLCAPGLNIAYRRQNVAGDRNLARALLADQGKREQLRQMYALEFPLYEYVANELFPGYQREYGPGLERDLEEFRRRGVNRFNYFNFLCYKSYRRLIFMPRLRRALAAASPV